MNSPKRSLHEIQTSLNAFLKKMLHAVFQLSSIFVHSQKVKQFLNILSKAEVQKKLRF